MKILPATTLQAEDEWPRTRGPHSDQLETWVPGQNRAQNWVLGVAVMLDSPLLNAANSMAVSFVVPSGGSFVVFAVDYLNREFVPGARLTLVATFATTASTTIPSPPPAKIIAFAA